MSDKIRSYDVGYEKPPMGARFKMAQSLDSKIAAELDKPVTISQGGKQFSITKRKAIVLQICIRAMRGDVRFLEMALRHLSAIEPHEPEPGYIFKFLDNGKPLNTSRSHAPTWRD